MANFRFYSVIKGYKASNLRHLHTNKTIKPEKDSSLILDSKHGENPRKFEEWAIIYIK